MALNKYAREYEHNSVFTATPEELTFMLYSSAVKFIKQARVAIGDKLYDKGNENCIKAQNIIHELMSTLDMKYDISKQLYNLYDYIYRRLVEGNLKKDDAILMEAQNFVEELRDTWEQAMRIAKRNNAGVPARRINLVNEV